MSICTSQTYFKFRHKHKCYNVGRNAATPFNENNFIPIFISLFFNFDKLYPF